MIFQKTLQSLSCEKKTRGSESALHGASESFSFSWLEIEIQADEFWSYKRIKGGYAMPLKEKSA
ncbi:MAG: hypothetical protein ACTFAL_04430 [Candidatus Electronema sp. V4]|uniref:hypothetical protein n=1 Tax=Candidatus Electronema sp. V4 TaxID=3454756 RepID=UPI0040556912